MKNFFKGFTREGIIFLIEVAANNSREWFLENRKTYDAEILMPLKALVSDMGETMHGVDKEFETAPAVGKTISRLNRDTRFSKDKTLYRDRMWVSFRKTGEEWETKPGYFFEIGSYGYCYGFGYYMAAPAVMKKLREKIDNNPELFLELVRQIDRTVFKIEGEEYKRRQKVFGNEIDEFYNKKSFYLINTKAPDEKLFSPFLVEELKKEFIKLKPLYDYLVTL